MYEFVGPKAIVLSFRTARAGIATAALASLLAGSVVGAEKRPSSLIRVTDHAKLNVRLMQLHQSRSAFDGADVVGNETILRPSVRIPYAKWGEIDLSTRYDARNYDFDGRSDLVDGEESQGTPFDALHRYRVRLGTNIALGERTFLSAGGFMRAKWESGADLGDATRYGGFAAIGLQPDPRFFLGIGLATQTKLRGGKLRFAPIGRIRWQVLERVDLLIDNSTTRIRIDLNRKVRLHFIARYEERKYWLRDRGGDRATWLKERRVPVRVRLEWRPSTRYQINFDLGAFLGQRLKTNALGSKQSIDQGATVFFGMGIRFRN